MKKIKISEKEYQIKTTAATLFEYRNIFNRSLVADRILAMNGLYKNFNLNKIKDLEKYGEVLEILLRIAYISIIKEERPGTFEEFTENIDGVKLMDEWVTIVIEELIENFSI